MALPHSKLVHVRLPHENSPLVKELLDHCSIVGWTVVCGKSNGALSPLDWHTVKNTASLSVRLTQTFQHPGSTCGLDIFCAEVVLDCKGDSIQRAFGGTWTKTAINIKQTRTLHRLYRNMCHVSVPCSSLVSASWACFSASSSVTVMYALRCCVFLMRFRHFLQSSVGEILPSLSAKDTWRATMKHQG